MKTAEVIDRLFRDAFEDVALLIGGTAAVHRLRDDLVRTLVRRLDGVRQRTLARLRNWPPARPASARAPSAAASRNRPSKRS
jgi:hypothetical protein